MSGSLDFNNRLGRRRCQRLQGLICEEGFQNVSFLAEQIESAFETPVHCDRRRLSDCKVPLIDFILDGKEWTRLPSGNQLWHVPPRLKECSKTCCVVCYTTLHCMILHQILKLQAAAFPADRGSRQRVAPQSSQELNVSGFISLLILISSLLRSDPAHGFHWVPDTWETYGGSEGQVTMCCTSVLTPSQDPRGFRGGILELKDGSFAASLSSACGAHMEGEEELHS